MSDENEQPPTEGAEGEEKKGGSKLCISPGRLFSM